MSKGKNFTHIFERIAAEHNTTVEEIRREIETAIQVGFNHPDPKVQAQWAKIPRKGEMPTPDELITYIVRQTN
ncbi:MAG TPA: sporulation initiation factor Spo0A [Desulfitobacterium dehalogenans]|uniref:Sporulation initiation factor Spo0A n=1 Tax=Desulfitobacterium dehalogenans TaxID=36854 RepID=A0A7C6Z5S9_9FIRM|nr:sporulation initiation factor Spo0A [Desulfitobacterium dehalogenans]